MRRVQCSGARALGHPVVWCLAGAPSRACAGLAIVRAQEAAAAAAPASGAAAAAGVEPTETSFVRELLDLHRRCSSLVKTEFQGEPAFQKALKEGFEVFINRVRVFVCVCMYLCVCVSAHTRGRRRFANLSRSARVRRRAGNQRQGVHCGAHQLLL